MYSRPSAFGPPSRGQNSITKATASLSQSTTSFHNFDILNRFDTNVEAVDSNTKTTATFTLDSRRGYNYPFTPPYYHGEAWCHITFTASSDSMTIRQIQESAKYQYLRHDSSFFAISSSAGNIYDLTDISSAGPQGLKKINRNAVQLSASLNIKGIGQTTGTTKGSESQNLVVDSGLDESNRWVIQTKFETPMLNFAHVSGSDHLSLPEYGSGSVPRGMWHQHGRIPEENEGVFLEVGPIPENYQTQVMAIPSDDILIDLSETLGFSGNPTKIGRIRSSKTIYEAVVAVPFIDDGGRKKFFSLDGHMVAKYKAGGENRASLTSGDPQDQIGRSVLNQMQKMEKYIFPPSFDFINNDIDEVKPIAMYIFEFSHTLSQQDLSDIWQNLPPDIGTEMEESEVAITHPLLKKELLGEGGESGNTLIDMPNKLRWMVFKVKQRADSNYFKKTVLRNPNVNTEVENSNVTVDEFGNTSTIQYNWPYDFFSLVELVKLDAEVEFGNFKEEDIANYTTSIPPYESQQADMDKIESIVGGIEDEIIPDNVPPEPTIQDDITVSTEVFAGQGLVNTPTLGLSSEVDSSSLGSTPLPGIDETANDVVKGTGGKTYAELGIPSPKEMRKKTKAVFRKELFQQLPKGKTWKEVFDNNFTRAKAQRIRNRTKRRTRNEIYGGGYGYTRDRYPKLDQYIGSININEEFPNLRGR